MRIRKVPEWKPIVTTGDLGDEIGAFWRAMKGENKSANTLDTYGESCRQFADWMAGHSNEATHPTECENIRRGHVDDWLGHLRDREGNALLESSTINNRFRGLQRFFAWWAGEAGPEVVSPMARIKPPKVVDLMPRVLTDEQIGALLAQCSGRSFEDVRDTAIIRVFGDTGLRSSELGGMRHGPDVQDLHIGRGEIYVLGKGGKDRKVQISSKTVAALDIYLRAWRKHRVRDSGFLWLGLRGPLTSSGILQMLHARGDAVGIGNLHPHDLRHVWRDRAERAGLSQDQMMALGGWSSPAMLARYARTTRNERALEAAKQAAVGDRW